MDASSRLPAEINVHLLKKAPPPRGEVDSDDKGNQRLSVLRIFLAELLFVSLVLLEGPAPHHF